MHFCSPLCAILYVTMTLYRIFTFDKLCNFLNTHELTKRGFVVEDFLVFFFVVCGVPGDLSACALDIMLIG